MGPGDPRTPTYLKPDSIPGYHKSLFFFKGGKGSVGQQRETGQAT